MLSKNSQLGPVCYHITGGHDQKDNLSAMLSSSSFSTLKVTDEETKSQWNNVLENTWKQGIHSKNSSDRC